LKLNCRINEKLFQMSDLDKKLQSCLEEVLKAQNEMQEMTEILEEDRNAQKAFETGILIAEGVTQIDSEEFLDAATHLFNYKKPLGSLVRELAKNFEETKGSIISSDKDDNNCINEENFQDFWTRLLHNRWTEKISGQQQSATDNSSKQEDDVENSDTNNAKGEDLKVWSPELVIVPQVFKLKEDSERVISGCPPIIIEFQKYNIENSQEIFYSPAHQIATSLVRCLGKYENRNPPKYFVGIMLFLSGAEMLIVDSQAILKKTFSKDTVIQVSFQWNFQKISQMIQENEIKDKEAEKFSEMLCYKQKKNKTSEFNAKCSYGFFVLVDFIVEMLLNFKTA